MSRATGKTLTLLLSAVIIGGFAAPPAAASVADDEMAETSGETCVVNVQTKKQRCFDSFAQAVSHATAGKVRTGTKTARQAAADPAFERQINAIAATPAASYVLSIEWLSGNFSGAQRVFTATGPCDSSADLDWQLGYVGDDWNDRITSFRGYSNCLVKHWEHKDFRGLSTGLQSESSNLGILDNRTSALQWF
ncbi:hypothetical protein [Kribbella catacumbae]|uniref:hypothetical protein n=1 Tax=Kribbella catacumbae TaxID=460086 RepID=UPI000361542B|nr:hypothetical protein [Kribbella catacumbae]